jgi:Tfp pilus assembly protein PilX
MNKAIIFPARSGVGQRGVTLVFALITLLALSLAAVALIRSVDTGSTILGNLSFKQDTLLASETASRQALDWINKNISGATLESDSNNKDGNGYLAAHVPGLDPLGKHGTDLTRTVIDWDGNNCATYPAGSYAKCVNPSRELDLRPAKAKLNAGDIKARYLITRLCDGNGNAITQGLRCAQPLTVSSTSQVHGSMDYATQPLPPDPTLSQYFRIIVRAQGARNSVSYTETLVHF